MDEIFTTEMIYTAGTFRRRALVASCMLAVCVCRSFCFDPSAHASLFARLSVGVSVGLAKCRRRHDGACVSFSALETIDDSRPDGRTDGPTGARAALSIWLFSAAAAAPSVRVTGHLPPRTPAPRKLTPPASLPIRFRFEVRVR